MTRPAILSIGHDRFDVLALGRRVASALAGEAIDTAAALSMADRFALATLSLAVEAEAARRAGAEPITDRARAWLADELAAIERQAATPIPAASVAGTSNRGHHHAHR